jgi:hypothetical protein
MHEIVAGPLRVVIERRQLLDDEGPSVRVYGRMSGREVQVLRFDCFTADPHYHYDPDGRNERHHMRDEDIADPMEWTLHRLERDLASMIRRAGYSGLADQVAGNLLEPHREEILGALGATAAHS